MQDDTLDNLAQLFMLLMVGLVTFYAVRSLYSGIPTNNHQMYTRYYYVRVAYLVSFLTLRIIVPLLICTQFHGFGDYSCESSLSSMIFTFIGNTVWFIAECYLTHFIKITDLQVKNGAFGLFGLLEHLQTGNERPLSLMLSTYSDGILPSLPMEVVGINVSFPSANPLHNDGDPGAADNCPDIEIAVPVISLSGQQISSKRTTTISFEEINGFDPESIVVVDLRTNSRVKV